MSGQVVGWAMKQKTGSPAAKLVLVKMADNASDDGLAWPAPALIVEHTELGQSTVYRHIATLEGLGLIEPVTVCVNPGKPDEYSCPGWQLAVPSEWRIPAARKRPAAGKATPAERKAIPAAGKPYKEEPSLEPSLNRQPVAALGLQARVDALRAAIGDETYNAWLGDSEFVDGDPIKIVVPKEFKRIRIKERLWDKVARAFGENVMLLLKDTPDA